MNCERSKILLNGIWNFHYSDTEANAMQSPRKQVMIVPGCFDLIEPYCGKRGWAAYSRTIRTGGMNLLEIDGAGICGKVFWDGVLLGELPFPYMPEEFYIQAGEEKEHELTVLLENHFNDQFHPDFDFFGYGGIYGDVTLTRIPDEYISKVHISTEDYRKGKIRVRAEFSNGKTTPVELSFDTGFRKQAFFENGKLDLTLELPSFKLWSCEHPELHRLTLSAGNDKIETGFGIREFSASGRKLLLNGKPVKLYGVNRHESYPSTGAAVSPQMAAYDLNLLKNAGYNFVRGSHYPQRKTTLDLCDRLGLLVWEEALGWGIPAEDLASEDYVKSQLEQVGRMTCRSFNHPCVVMRGFLNETVSQYPETRSVIKALYDKIRSIDEHTLISFSSNQYEKDCCTDLVDIVSMNPYPGWYDANYETISTIDKILPRLKKLSAALPQDKPFLITEIGGEALFGFRDPLKTYWSEEYQSELLTEVMKYVSRNDDCAGVAIWLFADTRSYVSGPHIFVRSRGFNNKGIVDEYRRPKLSWHRLTDFLKTIKQ